MDSRADRDLIPGLARLGREPLLLSERDDSDRFRAKLHDLLTRQPKLLDPAQPPPAREVSQLDWDDISRFVELDRQANPDHYAGEPPLNPIEVTAR